uniref:Uncharacterized protein n=1 Tax=Romanomermis culicivorax TaxID=13658 RepID=A0A915KH94_ROMCU
MLCIQFLAKQLSFKYGIEGFAIFPAPTSSFETVWKQHQVVLFRIKFMSLVDEELLTNTKLIRRPAGTKWSE